MKTKEKQRRLYPILFNGKKYYEKDCDPLFATFYAGPETLRYDGSVYVADGLWIYPDGESEDES